MKTFKKFLILFFVISAGKFCLAITECELAKNAISNDVRSILIDIELHSNSIHHNLDPLCNTNLVYQYWNGSEYALEPLDSMSFYDPNGGVSVGSVVTRAKAVLFQYDSFTNSITRECKDVFYQLSRITCSGSNTCNCAEYLEPIRDHVERIKVEVVSMQSMFDELLSVVTDIKDNFDNVFEYYNFLTNQLSWVSNISGIPAMLVKSSLMQSSSSQRFSPLYATNTKFPGYNSNSSFKDLTLAESIGYGFENTLVMLASLNNYFGTNTISVSSLHKSSVSNNVALGTVSRLLDLGFGSVSNQFSIFIESSSGASPVLGEYTSNDGSYHDYLTNYYIKVSSSSVSGSTPLTNWFNRIEMLLAALVFQDDDGPNTNSVPGSSSYDNLESELNQNMTTINQQGQDYLNTVDTSGKSLLAMLREWNGAVSGVAKPSAFVIATIPIPNGNSQSDSLDISLDTDNESLAGFIELVRGVTTLAWVTLFLVVGYFLSIRIITLIGKLISFGYSVYSAVFGGG